MKTIKYILSCIVMFLDAWVGKDTSGGIKDAIVGFSTMLIVIAVFFTSLHFFDTKTAFNYAINVLCSIGVTLLFVCVTMAIIILVEGMLHQ